MRLTEGRSGDGILLQGVSAQVLLDVVLLYVKSGVLARLLSAGRVV